MTTLAPSSSPTPTIQPSPHQPTNHHRPNDAAFNAFPSVERSPPQSPNSHHALFRFGPQKSLVPIPPSPEKKKEIDEMARGNQRDKAREKNQKAAAGQVRVFSPDRLFDGWCC